MKLTIDCDDDLVPALAYLNDAEHGGINPASMVEQAKQFVIDAVDDMIQNLIGVPMDVVLDSDGNEVDVILDEDADVTVSSTHLVLGGGGNKKPVYVPIKEGDNVLFPYCMSGERIVELYETYRAAQKAEATARAHEA